MRKFLSVFLLLLSFFPISASAEDGVELFARYECSGDNIIAGDSTLVNVVLYCNYPFSQAECTTKNIKIKGGHSRLVERRGQRQQQRVRLQQGIFYAIVWDTYVVGSSRVEDLKFPELRFDCKVEIKEGEDYYSPFDPFGFFSRPQRKSRVVEDHVKCPAFTLPVVERPKRSTQEAIRSGSQVA